MTSLPIIDMFTSSLISGLPLGVAIGAVACGISITIEERDWRPTIVGVLVAAAFLILPFALRPKERAEIASVAGQERARTVDAPRTR